MAVQVFSELKRRNVIRVGGVYAVTAWALFQIAKTVFEVLELPKWSTQLTFLLLALGLPIAMIIAWAFERAPEGGVRRTAAAAGPPGKFTPLDIGLLAGLAVVIGISTAQISGLAPSVTGRATLLGAQAPNKSVAVLPFISFSSQKDSEFFADGLTEEVINSLAQVPDLKVAGRTSAFYFKGKNEDLREIGRKLGVAHVVEGSVRHDGDNLRVTAQLINVADGFHIWSKTYDRKMDDAFAIQTEIAEAVSEALKTRLESKASTKRGAGDPEAYKLQLTARAHLRRLTLEDLQTARSLYERLTSLEPNNPSGWAGYAQATMLLAQNFLTLDFGDARQVSEAALAKAMKLDPNSVDAWLARAYVDRVLSVRTSDPRFLRDEQRAVSRVLALDPKNAEALGLQAVILSEAGDHAKAVGAAQRSLAIDPLNSLSHVLLGNALRGSGQLDAAADQYRKTIELFPDNDDAKHNLGTLLVEQGQLDKAVPWVRMVGGSGEDAGAALTLAQVYINLGLPKDATAVLAAVKTPPGSDYLKAAGFAARGDYAQTLAYSRERAVAEPEDTFWPQAIAIGAMMTRNARDGAAVLPKLGPSLLTPEPAVMTAGYGTSLMAAQLLAETGERAQARRIAEAILKTTAAGQNGYRSGDARIARVKAFALLGDKEQALAELNAAYQAGWRTPFDYESFIWIDQDPTTAILQSDPRFKAILAQVRADLARQRGQVLAERR